MNGTVLLCLLQGTVILLVLTGDLKQEDCIWIFLLGMIWNHHVICASYLAEI